MKMANGSEIRKLIGARIVSARKLLGWNQQGFARLLGISPQFLCQLECGKKSCPDDLMARITSSLGISPTDLMGIDEAGSAAVPDSVKIQVMIEGDAQHQRSLEIRLRFSALSSAGQNQLLREAEVTRMVEEFHGVVQTEAAFQQHLSALGDARIEIFKAWLSEMPKLEFKP
jgi:transcriptional regulator with XRE-family HTH domain